MKQSLDGIRNCLEGVIPGVVATCDATGMPNVSYVSQIHYVDNQQVALSFQFFNKTRGNMLQNPNLTAYLIDPETTARYRLALLYLRTETEGALFQSMKAKLAGIASHTGMNGIFALRGADICRVLDIEKVPAAEGPPLPPAYNRLSVLRVLCQRIVNCTDMARLFEEVLDGLETECGISHAMLLMLDQCDNKLYTVASRGYSESGVGSEIPLGCGVIGVAAQYGTPIRISHMAADYGYGKAMRENFGAQTQLLETAIPFPGLPQPHSQLALPIQASGTLLGVLYVESEIDMRFSYEDEDALTILAQQIGWAIRQSQQWVEADSDTVVSQRKTPPAGDVRQLIRFYPSNQSVFIDDSYLIKGVAGRILWRLLNAYVQEQRTEFSNRELRLDKQLNLPDVDDNLEARLILLQRRLTEKSGALAIVKTGRGRFRLQVNQLLQLEEADE